jgi:chromosome segregation ATPase
LFIVLLLALLGTAAGSAYAILELRRERDALNGEIRQQDQKIALLQKAYSEQKALAAGLQRTKVALESQKLSLEGEIAELNEEKAAVMRERDGLASQVAALEISADALRERIASLEATQEELVAERTNLTQELQEMTAARQTVAANLKRETRRLDRCAEHNTKLTEISQELMEVYRRKGVMSVLMEKEPLIGIRKIELQTLIDQYEERVEQQRIDDARRAAGEGEQKQP